MLDCFAGKLTKARQVQSNGDQQMSAKKKFKTVNEYIESQPEDTKRTLLALRAIILKAVPDATELFNYDIPAYALVKGGKRDKQIMIAGYKTFAGFYTGTGILQHFSKELAGYKVAKASVQFPNNRPLPKTLIVEIIKFKKKTSTDSSKS
ncbi:MAG: iron chaperone [Methylococcales bacterium]